MPKKKPTKKPAPKPPIKKSVFSITLLALVSTAALILVLFLYSFENAKNNDLQIQINSYQIDTTKMQTELDQLKEDSEEEVIEEVRIYPPYCFSYMTNDEYIKEFSKNELVNKSIINNFFNNPELVELEKDGKLYQVCYSYRDEISFVLFGEYGDYNNVIGIFTGEEFIIDKQYNKGMGDIGLCSIDGYIERNLIYACGGGDGPGGHNSIYILDRSNQDSVLIKKCSFFGI